MKVTERSALVPVGALTHQLTSHSGLVLVRELAGRFGVGELLDRVTVKKRSRGYSPAQAARPRPGGLPGHGRAGRV